MSADRELLRLAAKAAGAQWSDYSDRTPDHWQIKHADGVWREWKPLADDGDALRLAIKLGIEFIFRGDQNTYVVARQSGSLKSRFHKQPGDVTVSYVPESRFSSDYPADVSHAHYLVNTRGLVRGVNSATRSAIVRAAAALGELMP